MNRSMMSLPLRTAMLFVLPLALGACASQEEPERLGQVSQAVVTDCDYLNPVLVPSLPVLVDYDHELMIRDLSVVEDPCRTTWTLGGACIGTRARWTFGFLMDQLSGTRAPEEFVAEWLNDFVTANVVNGHVVPPRGNFQTAIVEPWLIASGCAPTDPIVGAGACPLDLKQAPFRLMAIVNRVDLAGPTYGSPSPGEMRFVFNSFDLPSGAEHQATFILEYELPSTVALFDWANEFHQLSGMPMGSAAYLSQLQMISDLVTLQGSEPGAPNLGSAIGQLRTNDIDLGFTPEWALREFKLSGGTTPNNMLLQPATTAQTPDNTTLFSFELDDWLAANAGDIDMLQHKVPNTHLGLNLLGGDSLADFGFVWNHSGFALSPNERHMFGFSTCNGCHTNETDTPFTHIDPRPAGAPSNLSGFLSAPTTLGSGGLPSGFHTVPDPSGMGGPFEYNEPWRRMCEATRILHGDPTPYTNGAGVH